MLKQLVNILSCPHSSLLRLLSCIQSLLEDGINNYCWAFLWHLLLKYPSPSLNSTCLYMHTRWWICMVFLQLPCKEKEKCCHRGDSSTVTSFWLVWDCELTQNYSNLFSFRVQWPLKLHVSWKLPSFECLGGLHWQCPLWGVQERSKKSVTYGESFGFNDLPSSSQSVQGSSRAESSSPVQHLAVWTRFSSLPTLVIQLWQSLLPVEIDLLFYKALACSYNRHNCRWGAGGIEPYQKW